MLMQKVGIDAVVNEETDETQTLEINGFNSGYHGLLDLGLDPNPHMRTNLGKALAGRKVLVGLTGFIEDDPFSCDEWLAFHDISVDFVSGIKGEVSETQLEKLTRKPPSSYDVLVGLGGILQNDTYVDKMMNSSGVELATLNKIAFHHLMKHVPDLRMPEAEVIDISLERGRARELQARRGNLFSKTPFGSLGWGAAFQDATSIDDIEAASYDLLDINVKEIGYNGIKTPSFVFEYLQELVANDPVAAKPLIDRWFKDNFMLFQDYVPSKKVRNPATGKMHAARARLIWWGEYIGGYWGLSLNPVDGNSPSIDLVVNYSTTRTGVPFTPEENERFKCYAERVVPQVLQAAHSFGYEAHERLKRDLVTRPLEERCLVS